jgi:hypothetical protein
MPDWLVQLMAGVLAVAGALLAAWALFWDRPRGRRRCPKCWYDMAGVPGLVCPECGLAARDEGDLLRTRRRWRLAGAAVVLLLSAITVSHVPAYRAGGIWAAVPRPVLIWFIPSFERLSAGGAQAPTGTFAAQAGARLFDAPWELKRLWIPERALLVARARRALVAEDSGDRTREFAARVLVLSREDAVEMVPPEHIGPVILARCALTYARASSYRDRGMVKGNIGIRAEKPFITAFVREGAGSPQRFRFEFLSGHPHQRHLPNRLVIWAVGDDVKTWWTIRPDDQSLTTLRLAIAGATGVSGGSGYRVPSMLLDEVGGRAFTTLASVRLVDVEMLEGRRAYRVSGILMGDTEEYWIDAERFVLLRVERGGQYPSMTLYEPEIDVEIDESWFTFDPERPEESPLQDPDPPPQMPRR